MKTAESGSLFDILACPAFKPILSRSHRLRRLTQLQVFTSLHKDLRLSGIMWCDKMMGLCLMPTDPQYSRACMFTCGGGLQFGLSKSIHCLPLGGAAWLGSVNVGETVKPRSAKALGFNSCMCASVHGHGLFSVMVPRCTEEVTWTSLYGWEVPARFHCAALGWKVCQPVEAKCGYSACNYPQPFRRRPAA